MWRAFVAAGGQRTTDRFGGGPVEKRAMGEARMPALSKPGSSKRSLLLQAAGYVGANCGIGGFV
jgi:hypothetical protein